jgi:hypothetical protein
MEGWFAIALDWLCVVATIFPEGVSYWELLDATNLTEGDTLGWSDPKYVGLILYSDSTVVADP